MGINRRNFINLSAAGAGTAMIAGATACTTNDSSMEKSILDDLQPMAEGVAPIAISERETRIRKAQVLMQENGVGALLLDAGTSLNYFTGISWWPSERPMVTIIPASGEVRFVCPGFEEERLNEIMELDATVYPWQEDESPYKQIALALKDAGVTDGKLAIEERVRFFILDGIKKEVPQIEYVSGDVITIPIRIIKSASEIALMQKATDITIEAIKVGLQALKEGSSPSDFTSAVELAHRKLGAQHTFAMANFAAASAFPHGSTMPQTLKRGDVVLVDCGCAIDGYKSDISRTIVFDQEPTARQQEIWDLEKKSQLAGYEAAKIGAPLKHVDEAARKVITDAGFGPGYALPGLPHRTGHGIGMDGHEWGNAVKGNERILEAGMCFSIEPNISIVGEFGVRHEDCVYMTSDGPKWFSQPSPSIDQPFV
jgi:Xaa-Pro dipeptidase